MLALLKEMASYYQRKKPENVIGVIQLQIGEKALYEVRLEEKQVLVVELTDNKQFSMGLKMSEETFEKLASGTWNGMTAVGRAKMSDAAPIDFRLPPGASFQDVMQLGYHFLTHFFSRSYPTVTQFGREHARKVHGGYAVPIAYGHGIRHAYYTIKAGEQINEDERDPWLQVFSVIAGKGIAIIDGIKVLLQPGMAVHVPPMVEHVIRAQEGEDDLELLWTAYGNKA